jgi:hypothetical protein
MRHLSAAALAVAVAVGIGVAAGSTTLAQDAPTGQERFVVFETLGRDG